MGTIALVDAQIDEGLSLLTRLHDEQFPIEASCWVKPSDEDRWSLFIATPVVDQKGITAAARVINAVVRAMKLEDLFDSCIKLIGTTNRTAQALLELQRGRPGARSDILLGNVFADEAYVYPPPGQKPVTLYGLVFKGEPNGAINLSFEPYSRDLRLVIGKGAGSHEYPAQTGLDWIIATPSGSLERDETGRLTFGWELHGQHKRSDASTVFSLAKLGLHGFRVLQSPIETVPQPVRT